MYFNEFSVLKNKCIKDKSKKIYLSLTAVLILQPWILSGL